MACLEFIAGSLAAFVAIASAVLFWPPARDKFFTTALWPWSLPWDTDEHELAAVKALAQPGDVLVESNLHGWQWIALCLATTRTSWVHAAIVDNNKQLLTVHKEALETDWSLYIEWRSTRLALIRPPYESESQKQAALSHARRSLGTPYDPSFKNHNGNCNGLVGNSLAQAGLPPETLSFLGRELYPANCFFELPGAQLIWSSDDFRKLTEKVRQELRS
jgi:hypothetical protein